MNTNQRVEAPQISRRRLGWRYARTLFFFGRITLSVIFWDILLRRVGLRKLARRTSAQRYRRAAGGFRRLAANLGGVWIKVGQFLSARVDVLPPAITEELSDLQDEVAPEDLADLRRVAEADFAEALETRYAWFDLQPLASASLGQVHRARLSSGEGVVVKIQRPGIHEIVEVDLSALSTVLGWLKRYRPVTRRVNLDALFSEFSASLWEELDYLQEADNARRLAAMFDSDPGIRIPRVYADYTTTHVLTLEDVFFIKITDYDRIEAAGVRRSEVADRLFDTYLEQIFIQGFFHADPHPGNLFVEPLGKGAWRLVFVDFGMVGRLNPQTRAGLGNLAIAFGTRDLDRLMESYQQLGVLLPGANLERIREAEGALLNQLWGKSMRDLASTHPQDMRAFASEFRDVLYEMPFQVPTDLIFFGRTIAILSGMCTGLNPDFNLFEGLAPFARQLLSAEDGDWLDTILDWLIDEGSLLLSLPKRLNTTLTRLENGTLILPMRAAPELELRLRSLNRALNRLVGAVIFAALLLAGILLINSGQAIPGSIGLGLSLLALLLSLRS